MDITTMRIVATLASLACFVGIWFWAFMRRNRRAFSCARSAARSGGTGLGEVCVMRFILPARISLRNRGKRRKAHGYWRVIS